VDQQASGGGTNAKCRIPLSGVTQKTFARTEFFSV
jgi:hypothetical protein